MFTEELLLEVNSIVQEQGADFAFPTRTLVMEPTIELPQGV
jgi:hypothetical protein